ncbi:MAG: hypothetical protein Q4C77_00455 [Eubacteriales bacterium]|nr:hypothetical protein [Eubacteriales bacterium]
MNSSENSPSEQDFIGQTALDQMVGSDRCQMLKAAIPYLPPSGRRFVSLYTKVQELANTVELFSPSNQSMEMCAASVPNTDTLSMLQDIRRFCYGESRKKLDEMVNMMAVVQMLQMLRQ